jgi:hypothetical protein
MQRRSLLAPRAVSAAVGGTIDGITNPRAQALAKRLGGRDVKLA